MAQRTAADKQKFTSLRAIAKPKPKPKPKLAMASLLESPLRSLSPPHNCPIPLPRSD